MGATPVEEARDTSSTRIEYAPGIQGKGIFRVRERCIADSLALLIRSPGAVKLYLILRGICLPPDNHGSREPGEVLPHVTYEDLHDLCRDPRQFSTATPEDYVSEAEDRAKKREWVREQLAALEDHKLVRRHDFGTGDRPRLVVLKDDGSGDPIDDPDGGAGSSYVTVHGSVLSAPTFLEWGAPEVFAYLCAMVAGRYAANKQGGDPASATWFQAAKWFTTDETARPMTHVLFPIGAKTIQRGLRRLTEQGWIQATKTSRDPRGRGRRFRKPRNVYENRFDAIAPVVDLSAERGRRLA